MVFTMISNAAYNQKQSKNENVGKEGSAKMVALFRIEVVLYIG
jgi:hypothetical protein